jgi:F-type H+-transporting ATPase subunit b
MRDIDAEARRHVQEAVADGQRVKDEIIARAREEAEDLREKQERLLGLEVAKARIEMRDEIVAMTMAATEKLLRESVDSDRHRRLVGDFLAEVQQLSGGDGGEN